jgi:hypothetical protein
MYWKLEMGIPVHTILANCAFGYGTTYYYSPTKSQPTIRSGGQCRLTLPPNTLS